MSLSSLRDHTHQLQQLMQQVGFFSFKALRQAAGVSEAQVKRLRQGQAEQIQVNVLLKLSGVLKVSLLELLATFSERQLETTIAPSLASPELADLKLKYQQLQAQRERELTDLRQEYDRLQTQLEQQRQDLQQEFQQSSLQVLEPWLLQVPTAAYAAQQNPQAPAVKMLPLLRPIEHLLQQWEVVAIAPVGAEVPYNPQLHQLMEGTADLGDLVRVRYTGYFHQGNLLYRAKVSLISRPDRVL